MTEQTLLISKGSQCLYYFEKDETGYCNCPLSRLKIAKICDGCEINYKKSPAITFTHIYKKMLEPVFPTTRRYDHAYEIGQIRPIAGKVGYMGLVRIVYKFKKPLSEIPTPFLLYDTDAFSRENAIQLINSFYETPIRNDEIMTLLRLAWVKRFLQPNQPKASEKNDQISLS